MSTPDSPLHLHAPGLSVLVVDDVLAIQELIRRWLGEEGCLVQGASTGEGAAQLLQFHPFDLVITDIVMPDGDGLEVIAETRRTQPAARVLAISGGGTLLQAADCLKFARTLGAKAVLRKPFNREQLLAAVNQVFQDGGPGE